MQHLQDLQNWLKQAGLLSCYIFWSRNAIVDVAGSQIRLTGAALLGEVRLVDHGLQKMQKWWGRAGLPRLFSCYHKAIIAMQGILSLVQNLEQIIFGQVNLAIGARIAIKFKVHVFLKI